MRATRGRFFAACVLLLAAALAAAASGGCSVLIGVAGDPVVVDGEGGLIGEIDAAVESGDETDASSLLDAASADETDAGGQDAADAAGD